MFSSILLLSSFNRKSAISTFTGQKHENRYHFIKALEDYFIFANTPRPERIQFAFKMFKGEAEKILTQSRKHITWEEFAEEITEMYGSPVVVADLQRSLFDEEQRYNKSVVEFLMEKKALEGRLHPDIDEEHLVATMILLLKRDIRQFLFDEDIENVNVLIQKAKSVERNLDV